MYEPLRSKVTDVTAIPSQPPPLPTDRAPVPRREASQPLEIDSGAHGAHDQVVRMEGVYIISVAARILDMHPQTLRKYERLGLINPGRTIGMLRLYSREDIRKVRLIRHLGNMGLNLAGVEFALGTVETLFRLRRRLAALTEGTPLELAVEQEFAEVFRRLDLPLDDWAL